MIMKSSPLLKQTTMLNKPKLKLHNCHKLKLHTSKFGALSFYEGNHYICVIIPSIYSSLSFIISKKRIPKMYFPNRLHNEYMGNPETKVMLQYN